jgi:outer membrane protein
MILFLILNLAISTSNAAQTYSLSECYEFAVKRSETILDQQEQLKQTEEHYNQAIGAVLPQITATASYLMQQQLPNSSGFLQSTQPAAKITATQALFRGLREFATLKQLKNLTEAQQATKNQAELTLYQEIATHYFNLLTLDKDLQNIKKEIEFFEQRIKDLQGRVKIGRSRLSEVLTNEASLTTVIAESELIRGQIAATRALFSFVTGLPLDFSIKDTDSAAFQLKNVDEYLSQLENRHDIAALRYQEQAADQNVSTAWGAHLPSLDLTGNYYLLRSGFLQDIKWDATLSLSIPIFAGGATQSLVREAASQRQQAELALTRLRRQAESEIRSLHSTLQADSLQVASLEKAAQIAEKNFKEQTREYRLGLVTNIEVLQSLTSYHEIQRSMFRAKYAYQLDQEKMKIATGSKI